MTYDLNTLSRYQQHLIRHVPETVWQLDYLVPAATGAVGSLPTVVATGEYRQWDSATLDRSVATTTGQATRATALLTYHLGTQGYGVTRSKLRPVRPDLLTQLPELLLMDCARNLYRPYSDYSLSTHRGARSYAQLHHMAVAAHQLWAALEALSYTVCRRTFDEVLTNDLQTLKELPA